MKEIQNIDCSCTGSNEVPKKGPAANYANLFQKITLLAAGIGVWIILYN